MSLAPFAPPSARLRQCTDLEYLLLGDLQEMLEEPLTPTGVKWVLAVVETLLDTLPREHRLKSADGYLSEVLAECPNWSVHVDRLRTQYFELYDRLSDLRDDLEDGFAEPTTTRSVKRSLKSWMQEFASYQRRESDLLGAAVNLDLGGSG
jgi:hypothetical protein